MADGGYRGNPEVIIPYRRRKPRRQPTTGLESGPERPAPRRPSKGRTHPGHRMTNWKILRDYRRAARTLTAAASGIANQHNIALTW